MDKTIDRYTYLLLWSEEDGKYAGLCTEFPSLSWLSNSQLGALNGIISLVEDHKIPSANGIITSGILTEILAERTHQENKWGVEHDDTHVPNDWSAFLITYLGKAVSAFEDSGTSENKWRLFRYNMIKISAIAIAAIEAVDRKLK